MISAFYARATTLIFLLLFVVSHQAEAACAWLLWSEYSAAGRVRSSFSPTRATETKREGEAEIVARSPRQVELKGDL